MNEIYKWIEDGRDFDKGVALYSKYGPNQQLKEIFNLGYALFDIEKRLSDELDLLKDRAFIDTYTEEKKLKKPLHIKSVSKPKKESDSITQVVRELSPEMESFNLSKGKIVNQRNKRANELTDDSIRIERAKSIILEIKFLQTELNKIREQERFFVKTGEIPKSIVKQGDQTFEEYIHSITDIKLLQAELIKCKKRISKNKTEGKNNPSKLEYYSNAISINQSQERFIVNHINNLIPNAGQMGKTIRKRKLNS